MITQFRQGFLEATSNRIENPRILAGRYDVIILVSSWDARCVSITAAEQLSGSNAIVLLFDTKDDFGLRHQHDDALLKFASTSCENVVPIKGSSTDVELMWSRISAELNKVAKEARRPLRVFLDLSTCPRYYAAATIARCFRSGIGGGMTILYAEGRYPDEPEVTFSLGRWQAVPVPEFNGTYDPRFRRSYLVSVGWEGWRTLRVVSRADPDKVSVLFPDPGFEPGYVKQAEQRNSELLSHYCIPENHVIRAHAGDAVAAWKALALAAPERLDEENVSYLMTGTKPHAVALALRALVLDRPSVLYVIPEGHSVLRTQPNGKYWTYEIRDITVLPSSVEVT